jgi:hypothetical protein
MRAGLVEVYVARAMQYPDERVDHPALHDHAVLAALPLARTA